MTTPDATQESVAFFYAMSGWSSDVGLVCPYCEFKEFPPNMLGNVRVKVCKRCSGSFAWMVCKSFGMRFYLSSEIEGERDKVNSAGRN